MRRWLPYAAVALTYVVSRLVFSSLGVSFLWQETVAGAIQLPDPQLLREHYFHTLWHLHIQPPLFSAIVGAALKLFGDAAHQALYAFFLLCGLAFNLMIYRCLFLLTRARIALPVALLYAVAPSQLIYEHWLFYTHLTAVLLMASLWCLMEYAMSRRHRWGYGLAVSFALLCLLRGSFHLALFVLPWLLVARLAGWRRALRMFALPMAVVLAFYIKNFVMFGFFGPSSFMGMNIANIAVLQLPEEQKQSLFEATKSPLVFIKPFRGNADCKAPEYECKSTGYRDFNTPSILTLSRQYGTLAYEALNRFPHSYLRNVGMGLVLSTSPSERFFYTVPNLTPIVQYADWYDLLVWGAPYLIFAPNWSAENGEFPFMPGMTILFLLPVCLMTSWMRCIQTRQWRVARMPFAALTYMTVIMGYCLTVTGLFEYGENNRFRYDWEAFSVIIIAATLGGMFRKPHKKLKPLEP